MLPFFYESDFESSQRFYRYPFVIPEQVNYITIESAFEAFVMWRVFTIGIQEIPSPSFPLPLLHFGQIHVFRPFTFWRAALKKDGSRFFKSSEGGGSFFRFYLTRLLHQKQHIDRNGASLR